MTDTENIKQLADEYARAVDFDMAKQDLHTAIDALQTSHDALLLDAARLQYLDSNVNCASLNIDGQHRWSFNFGRGWTTGATFREAIDNAIKASK